MRFYVIRVKPYPMKTKLSALLAILISCSAFGQTKIDLQKISQFTVENRTIEPTVENGRPILKLSEAPGDGLVIVNQSASPCLQMVRLSETQTGKLAMWAGNGSNASFANLVITGKKSAK